MDEKSGDKIRRNKHQKLIDQIADGKVIDWSKFEPESEPDTKNLAKIKALEQISLAFARSIVTGTVPEAKTTFEPMFKWGHLKVMEKIGEGGFGEVYKAYDPILNRKVALKLHHSEMASATGNRAFLQEARRLARVRHPNVIAVHGAAFEDNKVGIWTDLIAGQNLKQYVLDNGLLDITTAFDLINDMAEALNAVHQAGLVHGDVKSSNVMCQNNDRFKLMDFGAGSESIDTELMPHAGTPLMMAPELFKGEPITPSSDMYSLGVMLYQLFSGQYPLTATSVVKLKQLHQQTYIKPLNSLHSKLPNQLCELIDSLLSKDPLERPSAAQLIQNNKWIKSAPQRRRKFWVITTVISSLSIGMLISIWGYVNAARSEEMAILSKQESVAVSDFLADILKSARPGESGKNTPIIEILEQADKRIETSLIDQPLARAEVLYHIGRSFQRISSFESAYHALNKAHHIRLQHLGKHHFDTLEVQGELGGTLSYLTRFDEAQELLFIDKETINNLPIENNQRMKFWVNQSLFHSANGNFSQAQDLLKQALTHSNPDIDPIYHYHLLLQYANSRLNQLHFDTAEDTLNEVYSWVVNNPLQKSLLLKTRSALVRLYGQTNRLKKAEEFVRLNIAEVSQWLGVEDESVLWSKSLLSKVLNEQGKYEESAAVNLEALNVAVNKFGEGYWLSLNLMSDQADLLQKLNQVDEAIKRYLQTIDAAEKAFPNHNYSLTPMKNLTALYFESEQYELASSLAKSTIPLMAENRGDDHQSTLELRFHYGASLLKLGHLFTAKELLNLLLLDATKSLGKDHVMVTNIINLLVEPSNDNKTIE